MWPFKPKKIVRDVETDLGNIILKDLIQEGWKISSEYSDLMWDKGLDFDSYTLKCGKGKLKFDWDNWTEWTITGTPIVIETISKKYSLLNSQPIKETQSTTNEHQ